MSSFEAKYPFTEQHAAYATLRLTQGATNRQIYDELTDAVPGRPDDVPKYDGTFSAARKQIHRITKGKGSAVAKAMRNKNGKGTTKPEPTFDLDTNEGQLAFIKRIINTSSARPADKLKALDTLRTLQSERIDKKDGVISLHDVACAGIPYSKELAAEVLLSLWEDLTEEQQADVLYACLYRTKDHIRVALFEKLSHPESGDLNTKVDNDGMGDDEQSPSLVE